MLVLGSPAQYASSTHHPSSWRASTKVTVYELVARYIQRTFTWATNPLLSICIQRTARGGFWQRQIRLPFSLNRMGCSRRYSKRGVIGQVPTRPVSALQALCPAAGLEKGAIRATTARRGVAVPIGGIVGAALTPVGARLRPRARELSTMANAHDRVIGMKHLLRGSRHYLIQCTISEGT